MNKRSMTVTYEPDNSLKKGYFQIFREILYEIKSNRWLTYQLFRRSFFSMYKQSFAGILWVIIIPIVNVCVFAILHNSGIFNIGKIDVPYPIFALSGMAFWQIFASGLGTCGNALTSAGGMVTRINFSKKSLIFGPLGRTVISFFIQLALVGALFLFYKQTPSIGIVFVPFIVIPIILFTLGIGFVVAALNAIVRDIGSILPMAITFLMYLTPILYAKPRIGILSDVTQYNPMFYFVTAGRDLILTGHISEVKGFIVSVIFSIILCIGSILVFHLTETRIAERV